jgi:hypothetical protein
MAVTVVGLPVENGQSNTGSNIMREAQLALKAHILVERDPDEEDVVLVDSRSGRMSACNETASMLVVELQKGSTVARLVETLVTRFSIPDDIATRDVNAVLDILAAEGLLETSE